MICLDLDDKIIERARLNKIGKNTRIITNMVLWGGFGILVITGTIGIVFLGNMIIIGVANKTTKLIIKNRKKLVKSLVS